MNIKELIQEQFPNSKHANTIKVAKLIDDKFIYTELNSGASVFYEIREGRLYIYKRNVKSCKKRDFCDDPKPLFPF